MALLEAACGIPREVRPRFDLIREGDAPGPLFVMLEGWACRYTMMPEGTRQITAFMMPGDCSDLYASILEEMDNSIATLTHARVAAIPRPAFEHLMFDHLPVHPWSLVRMRSFATCDTSRNTPPLGPPRPARISW